MQNVSHLAAELLCICGRGKRPPHCTYCGSSNCYAVRKNSKVVTIEGQQFLAKGLRCRKCGQDFTENDACAAPVLLGRQKDTATVNAVSTEIRRRMTTPRGRREVLAELLQKQGVIKDAKAAVAAMDDKVQKHPSHGENDEWRETNPLFEEDVERPGRD